MLTPGHERIEVSRDRQGTYNFTQTDELGTYDVQSGGKTNQRFAVNLFDANESEIRARAEESVKIGHVEVAGQSQWEPGRRELWRFLVLVALGVLLLSGISTIAACTYAPV